MTADNQEVFEAALKLSEADRAQLVEALLESLAPAAGVDDEEAWAQELDRRVDEIQRGKDEPLFWSELKEEELL